jgi:hypothetical protein
MNFTTKNSAVASQEGNLKATRGASRTPQLLSEVLLTLNSKRLRPVVHFTSTVSAVEGSGEVRRSENQEIYGYLTSDDLPMPGMIDPNLNSAVHGADAETTIDKEEIVTFTSDGITSHETNVMALSQNSKFSRTGREGRDHTVINFLERPYILQNFTWEQTTTPGGIPIAAFNFPEDLFAIPAIRDKLVGFTYFRGNMEVRLQLNAQPFQQGRLVMIFVPYGQEIVEQGTLFTLTGITGFDRTEIDIADAQEVSMTIPYVSPYPMIDLTTKPWNVGTFLVYVYGQTRGGDENITITAWARFQDVEVKVPTGAALYPLAPRTALYKDPNVLYGEMHSAADVTMGTIMKSSGGMLNPKLNTEIKAASSGTVTKIAAATSGLAMAAATIPVLTPLAAPIALVAGAVAGLGSLFGWSKPNTEKVPEPMVIQPGKYLTNYDGNDVSRNLGLSAKNSIGCEPLFGTSVDEMSIKYITSRPNYIETFPWTTADAQGKLLYSTPVVPNSPITPIPITGQTETGFQMTHLSYTCMAFNYWRGSIRYIFKFVKTPYHSGRIRWTYTPKGALPSGLPKTIDLARSYTDVVDIGGKTDFEVTIPLVYELPWVLNGMNPLHLGEIPGILTLTVVTALRRPNEIVSDQVDVIVEKSGGADFEVARPTNNGVFVPVQRQESDTVYGVMTSNTQEPTGWCSRCRSYNCSCYDGRVAPKEMYGQLHTLETVNLFKEAPNTIIPGAEDGMNDEVRFNTFGETIVSLKQLFQRFQLAGSTTTAQPVARIDLSQLEGYNRDTPRGDEAFSYFNYFMPLYAFWRGSMRCKIIYNADTGPSQQLYGNVELDYGEDVIDVNFPSVRPGTTTDFQPSYIQAMAVPYLPLEGMLEVQTPYYARFPIAVTNFYPRSAGSRFEVHSRIVALGPTPKTVLRGIGDDFSCGRLIGVPPVFYAETPPSTKQQRDFVSHKSSHEGHLKGLAGRSSIHEVNDPACAGMSGT